MTQAEYDAMSDSLKNAHAVMREGFAQADTKQARTAELPKWRWLKRHNLKREAEITRLAMGQFWSAEKAKDAYLRAAAAGATRLTRSTPGFRPISPA